MQKITLIIVSLRQIYDALKHESKPVVILCLVIFSMAFLLSAETISLLKDWNLNGRLLLLSIVTVFLTGALLTATKITPVYRLVAVFVSIIFVMLTFLSSGQKARDKIIEKEARFQTNEN